MLSLLERVTRQRSRRSRAVLLLAMIVMLIVLPATGVSSNLLAQDGGDAADTTEAPAPAESTDSGGGDQPVESRNFLGWMVDALGWFWMLVFAALSFVMVALIMMNLLQVRRDVLVPNDFVEEFEQKLDGKDFEGA